MLIYVSVDRTLVLWQIERGGAEERRGEERREIAREKGESARERRGEKANGVVGRRDSLLFEQNRCGVSAGIWIAEIVELEVWKIKKSQLGGGAGGEERGWEGGVCVRRRGLEKSMNE